MQRRQAFGVWLMSCVVAEIQTCDSQTMLLEQWRPNLDAFDGIGRPRWRRDVLFENRPRHGLALCRFSPNSGDSLGFVDIGGGHGKVSILKSIHEAHTNLRCHSKSRPFSIIVTRSETKQKQPNDRIHRARAKNIQVTISPTSLRSTLP